MALNKTLSFDLELKPGGIPPIIHASQGDIGRMFKANIYWDGAAATSYISGATVNLRGKKPDKTVFDYTATLAGSMVTFETTEQMTIISGPVECELVFSNDGDIIASANFVLMVEDSPYNPDAPSESVIPGIEDLIEQTIGGDVRDEVQAELEAHPEWTTTVQDGSITYAKLNDSLKAYVTPEMFGAKGDGVTDDATSIQSCIDYAKQNGYTVILGGKDYKCGSALRIGKVAVVGSGKDGNNTILRFSGSDGVIINDRGSFLQNCRIIQNTDGYGVGIDFDDGSHGTIPDVYINNVTVTHFEYGLRASESVSWSNKFDNLRLQFNKNALWFDSFTGSLTATHFCNEFNSTLIINVAGGKSVYLRGVLAIFNNANISCTSAFSVDVTSSYVQFNSSSFENDSPITNNAAMMSVGQNVEFNNCRFLHNYTTPGNNYFIHSQANTDLHLSFINCYEKAYTGSLLTSIVYPVFGVSSSYGSVYECGNNFSIYDTVYNNYKAYIQRPGTPISLFSNSLDLTKTKEKTIYDYHDETTGKRALVYVNGGQLYDVTTNLPYGVIAEKTTFTPTTGTDNGCYYEVIGGYLVHIHLAISGLTTNTVESLYSLPTAIRPKENMAFTYYNSNNTPSQYTTMAYGQITPSGNVLKYALNGVFADIYYSIA